MVSCVHALVQSRVNKLGLQQRACHIMSLYLLLMLDPPASTVTHTVDQPLATGYLISPDTIGNMPEQFWEGGCQQHFGDASVLKLMLHWQFADIRHDSNSPQETLGWVFCMLVCCFMCIHGTEHDIVTTIIQQPLIHDTATSCSQTLKLPNYVPECLVYMLPLPTTTSLIQLCPPALNCVMGM